MKEFMGNVMSGFAYEKLFWIIVTIASYGIGLFINDFFKNRSYINPVMISIFIVCAVMSVTKTSYDEYFYSVDFINFLLGPATIALAIPLAKNVGFIGRNFVHVVLSLCAGSITAIVSGLAIVWALGGSEILALSMLPKAVTTPIAVAVSEQIGGLPALTAALSILGGVVGACTGRLALHRLDVKDCRAHGLAAGVGGSGIAAAEVSRTGETAAAFAALGIAVNGVVTSIASPVVALFLQWAHLWR